MYMTGVRAINNTGKAVYVVVSRNSDGRQYVGTFQPGETYIAIPITAQNRIVIADTGRGHWNGFTVSMAYPIHRG
jgi:hypothetical protein